MVEKKGIIIPLSDAPQGSVVKVVSLPPQPNLRMRLMQMGLIPGAIIEIFHNNRGPLTIKVKGVMIGIGRGMARKILVQLIE